MQLSLLAACTAVLNGCISGTAAVQQLSTTLDEASSRVCVVWVELVFWLGIADDNRCGGPRVIVTGAGSRQLWVPYQPVTVSCVSYDS